MGDLFIVRAVFGTTEEDNNGGGLREWHNGAGEMYNVHCTLYMCNNGEGEMSFLFSLFILVILDGKC